MCSFFAQKGTTFVVLTFNSFAYVTTKGDFGEEGYE